MTFEHYNRRRAPAACSKSYAGPSRVAPFFRAHGPKHRLLRKEGDTCVREPDFFQSLYTLQIRGRCGLPFGWTPPSKRCLPQSWERAMDDFVLGLFLFAAFL